MTDSLVAEARIFALAAHQSIGQKYGDEDYSVHLQEVEDLLRSVGASPELLAAAWLHDVLEDVSAVTATELSNRFGLVVARLVEEATDISRPEDGSRAERKALDRKHTAAASPEGKTLKLADVTANLRRATTLELRFACTYLREKALLLPSLQGGHPVLYEQAHLALTAAAKQVGVDLREVLP